jgi:drug/metabolite transporter (DMT)-like permease
MSRRVALLRNDQTQHQPGSHQEGQEVLLQDGYQPSEDEEAAALLEAEKQKKEASKATLLTISFCLMLIFGLGNSATRVLQLEYIGTYPLFLSLVTTFIYVPVSFAYILPMIYFGKIDQAQRDIPMKTWIIIGGLDSVAGIIQVLAMAIIKHGTLIVLLSQTAIPISMITSKIFLGSTYSASHYIGVCVIMIGLIVVILPRFFAKHDDDSSDEIEYTTKVLLAIIAFIASNIPLCLSTVYKELSLGENDVDPIYLNGWVAFWQLLASFPLLIPAAYTEQVAVKDIPENLWNGAKCWLGINTYTGPDNTDVMLVLGAAYYAGQGLFAASSQIHALRSKINNNGNDLISEQQQINNNTNVVVFDDKKIEQIDQIREYVLPQFSPLSSAPFLSTFSRQEYIHSYDSNGQLISTKPALTEERKPDNCGKAPIFTNLYMFFNIIYNILIILLIKYGSANILFLCLTITVPLSAVFFTLPFLPNPKEFSKWDVVGLIVLLIGLIIYRFFNMLLKKNSKDGTDEEGSIDSATQGQVQSTGNINSDYAPPLQSKSEQIYQPQQQSTPYYGDVNVNVEDPFGDHEMDQDGYAVAEPAPTLTNSSSNASETNHGRKKVKKGRK